MRGRLPCPDLGSQARAADLSGLRAGLQPGVAFQAFVRRQQVRQVGVKGQAEEHAAGAGYQRAGQQHGDSAGAGPGSDGDRGQDRRRHQVGGQQGAAAWPAVDPGAGPEQAEVPGPQQAARTPAPARRHSGG
jgi:hypothetical protein